MSGRRSLRRSIIVRIGSATVIAVRATTRTTARIRRLPRTPSILQLRPTRRCWRRTLTRKRKLLRWRIIRSLRRSTRSLSRINRRHLAWRLSRKRKRLRWRHILPRRWALRRWCRRTGRILRWRLAVLPRHGLAVLIGKGTTSLRPRRRRTHQQRCQHHHALYRLLHLPY